MAIPHTSDNMMSLVGFLNETTSFSKTIGNANEIMQSLIDQRRAEFEQQISIAENNEKQILKALHVTSIDDLNKIVREYEVTEAPLSGPKLKAIFLQGFSKRGKGIREDLILEAIKSGFAETIEDKSILDEETITIEMINQVFNILHKQSGGKQKIRVSKDKISTQTGQNGKNYISFKGLTKAQKIAFKNLKKVAKENGISLQNKSIISSDINDNEAEMGVNWGQLTKNLTWSEAQQQISDEELKIINTTISEAIIQAGRTGQDQQFLRNIVNYILQDRYAFFVGQNEKDITGLLGEINGMFFIQKLFPNENIIGTSLQWIGSSKHNGVKPHRDIIFQNIGIQVKNTVANIDKYFSSYFEDASIETVLNSLSLEPETKEVIMNYYGSAAFNVPYHLKGEKAVKGNNMSDPLVPSYLSRRESLNNLKTIMNMALATFANSLMYITAKEKTEEFSEDTNDIYFVAGKSFILASQILKDIRDWIYEHQNPKSVHISYSTKTNIISAYNSGKRHMTIQQVSSNVNLTSSYTFKI